MYGLVPFAGYRPIIQKIREDVKEKIERSKK